MGRVPNQVIQPIPIGSDSDTPIGNKLDEITELLQYSILAGKKHGYIDILSLTTGATYQKLYDTKKIVTMALIQNLSTEVVSIANGSSANGARLNPANLAGEGGGNLPVGNIDLSELQFLRTTSGVTLAVYYEL